MRARRPLVVLLALLVLALALRFVAASAPLQAAESSVPLANDIRISQVYGGGGNQNAIYTHDFIELFNAGTTAVNIDGWSVQYASSTGTSWQTTPLSGSIQPGGYYLIQQAQGSGGTTTLPTPDASGTIAMSATAGKVALVNTTTLLTGACPTGAQIIDFVGFGGANCNEGSGPAPAPSNTTADIRNGAGCIDTDNNAADFTIAPAAPRNSASPLNPCGGPTPTPTATATPTPAPTCGGPATLISTVQGSGTASPLAGTIVSVRAIVTGDFQTGGLNGYFLQEEESDYDVDPNSSEALWVYTGSTPVVDVSVGDEVQVTGRVEEFGMVAPRTLTEINVTVAGSSVVLCSSGNTLPPLTPVNIPQISLDEYEQVEGMRVGFGYEMVVTGNFQHERYGEVELAQGSRLYQPTHLVEPGPDANTVQWQNSLRRIILDDGLDMQNVWPIVHPAGTLSNVNTLRAGDVTTMLTAFLDERYATATTPGYRVQPSGPGVSIAFTRHNARPAAPPAVGAGALRVAIFNVLNFFTTIDVGNTGCGPSGTLECRGADSVVELDRQRTKLVTAINGLNAHVVGLMEIENTSNTNLQDLVDALNADAGSGTWAFINSGTLGTDAIRVAILYKPGSVTPFGAFAVDDDPIHDRPILGQQFQDASGDRFTVAVVHFKSKGSCPTSGPDADQGDGQGCWNARRVQQAQRMLSWLDSTGFDPDRLLLGDFNSYAKEDPIDIFINAGYTNLIAHFNGPTAYGYVFSGQSGYLDYALASASLLTEVTGAAVWHINADEQIDFDYNDNVQDADEQCPRDCNHPDLYAVSPYRTSDHDPLVVGLAFEPLAVTLASFDATLLADGPTRVRWETVSEIDTLGFHLWRSADEGAPAERLTVALIPAQAGGGSQGAAYEWLDGSAGGTTFHYWLEDIDTSGVSTMHGPVLAQPEVPTAVTLGRVAGARPSPSLPLLALGALAMGAGLLLRRRA